MTADAGGFDIRIGKGGTKWRLTPGCILTRKRISP